MDTVVKYKFIRNNGSIEREDSVDCTIYDGLVRTRHGIVSVYSYKYLASKETAINFIHKDIEYVRIIPDKFYSPRYLVTLASRFAQEVVDGRHG